jgi:DNA-binding protein H-NS
MAKPNIASMDVEALLELRTKIDEHLLQRRSELEKQLTRLNSGTRVVRGGATSSTLKGRKVPAKYRLGRRTWAGRGMRPKWLVEAMKGSKKKLEDFLIDKKRA